MKYKLLIVIIILLQWSCTNENKDVKNSDVIFEQKYNVQSKLLIGSGSLLDPTIIEVLDSLIIVSNYKGDPLVEVHDTQGNSVKKIINKGKGPNEILITGRIQVDDNDKRFYVNDLISKKIIECKIENDEYKTTEIFSPGMFNNEKGENLFYEKLLIGNDILVAENRSPKGRLLVMDKKGNALGYYLKYPEKELVNPKLSAFGNAKLYASAVVMNPKRTKIAMATYSAGMINLIDIKKDSLIPIWSFNEFLPTNIEALPMGDVIVPAHTKESKSGYFGIAATNEYVYALYSGKLLKEKDYNYCQIIRVVNWKGNEFFELYLDQGIKRLAVSLDNERVFGISKNKNEEPEIIVFDTSFINKMKNLNNYN